MQSKFGFSLVLWVIFSSSMAMVPVPNQVISEKALHLDWFNLNVAPEQNFYYYANGTWLKENPIPLAYASWSPFYILQENMQKTLHQLLIELANNKAIKSGSDEQKVGDFYFSGMDEALINRLGATPLTAEFEKINAIKNTTDLQAVIAHLQLVGVNACFGFGSMQDFRDSNEMIGAAMQGGLGLPNRDYYLKKDKKFQEIRASYQTHIADMFMLLGDSPNKAREEARLVMAIETVLAKASMSLILQRDPHAIYHMTTVTALEKTMPHFSWPQYLQAVGQPTLKHINLAMPDFFKVLDEQLKTRPLDDWKVYLRWQLIDTFAPYLSKPFVDEDFKMTAILTGAKKLLPRWQRVVATENNALGFAIGKIYVEKYFSPKSKTAALQIVQSIKNVMRHDLKTLTWMAPLTRDAALKKLELMDARIGYPNKWWDYSTLIIDRGPYVLNIARANTFLIKRDLNKIGKPVDKEEWAMTPQTINAYYDPSMNNLNIPAGILQSPFFDLNSPASINYGAIGFIMGHEMTHGFDDQGAQFDGYGNLKNWWTPADLKRFKLATFCISKQFSEYTVNKNLHVQGQLVMGEAAADLGGLNLAYRAFHASDAYSKTPIIHGFTADQQFFVSMAHIWASNMRSQQLRNIVMTDPHPPAIYRVNGTLANMPQFQAAFNLPDASPMVTKLRCEIW